MIEGSGSRIDSAKILKRLLIVSMGRYACTRFHRHSDERTKRALNTTTATTTNSTFITTCGVVEASTSNPTIVRQSYHQQMMLLVLLFSSGYPLHQLIASTFSFCKHLGVSIVSVFT